jgi:insulysin
MNTPLIDKKKYRYIELDNKLKIVLIHDPNTLFSATSMNVGVGSFNDPNKALGLAHFLEHMLFMGTKKYPDENDYQIFLNTHGGGSNAYTDDEHTNYFFHIQNDYLEGGLDRFSQFFTSPLMKKETVNREMKAVHAEHQKNINNDMWREYRILTKLLDPEHPITRFSTGCLETLDTPDIYEQLWEFYNKFYSANIMYLSIYSSYNLDKLEKLAIEYFSDIPNKNVIISPIKMKKIIKSCTLQYVPINDEHKLSIIWLIPNDTDKFKLKIVQLICFLLGHEADGSIYRVLKNKHLISSLSANQQMNDKSGGLLIITININEKALSCINYILSIVYQYIELIKNNLDHVKHIYSELQLISRLQFKFLPNLNPEDSVVEITKNMRLFPIENILDAGFVYDDFSDQHLYFLNQIFDCLTYEKMSLMIGTQHIDKLKKDLQTEKWYGIKYNFIDNVILDTKTSSKLFLPNKNPFLPSANLSVPKIITDKEPFYISKISNQNMWCKLDNEFGQPLIYGMMCFRNPMLNIDPQSIVGTRLLIRLLNDQLTNILYYSGTAGAIIKFVTLNDDKFIIEWNGYKNQYEPILKLILQAIYLCDFDENMFKHERKNLIKDLNNAQFDSPINQSFELFYKLFVHKNYRYWELLEECKKLTMSYIQQLAKLILSESQITTILIGDIDIPKSCDFFEKLIIHPQKIKECPLLQEFNTVIKPESLPWLYEEITTNPSEINSCILYEFRIGNIKPMITPEWEKKYCCLDIIQMFLSEPFFDILRTKEQLGYIVKCIKYPFGNIEYSTHSLVLIVQSPTHPANYLKQRIDKFMKHQLKQLDKLTEKKFLNMKESSKKQYLEKDKNLEQRFNRIAYQIISNNYVFNTYQLIADGFDSLTMEDFKSAYYQWLINTPIVGQILIHPKKMKIKKIK